MRDAEVTAYIVQLRNKLDSETYTSEDAFLAIWNPDGLMTHEQRARVHLALELPFEVPNDLDFLMPQPIRNQ